MSNDNTKSGNQREIISIDSVPVEWFISVEEEVSPFTYVTDEEIIANGEINYGHFLKLVGTDESAFSLLARYNTEKAIANEINPGADPLPLLWAKYTQHDRENLARLKQYEKVCRLLARLLKGYRNFQPFTKFTSNASILIVSTPERCQNCERYEGEIEEVADKIPYPIGITNTLNPWIHENFKNQYREQLADGRPKTYFYKSGQLLKRTVGPLDRGHLLAEAEAAFMRHQKPKYFSAGSAGCF